MIPRRRRYFSYHGEPAIVMRDYGRIKKQGKYYQLFGSKSGYFGATSKEVKRISGKEARRRGLAWNL